MFKKANRVFQTSKYLKPKQVIYQIKYRLIKPQGLVSYGNNHSITETTSLTLKDTPSVSKSWHGSRRFTFLNLSVDFEDQINWNFQERGKLWNYNLQYANYLLESGHADSEKENLVADLYKWLSNGRLPLEPYPVSLRSINMIRWLSLRNIDRPQLNKNVYAELDFLSKRFEYHLLGNHLLENAFALIMGGVFFSNKKWVENGKEILKAELEEQILPDGAHFELSPMYHQIIFFRLLELIDWYTKWQEKDSGFENFLRLKACDMRAWLEQISFENGDIPHFNDSADGIAYSTKWLNEYAQSLAIIANDLPLNESGYRSVALGDYECKIDFAQLGPSYQPGHAHADALSFILHYNKKPVFVDTGTSTYEAGKRREIERQTASHNTVTIDNRNQSEVYGAFRVGHRAKTTILIDEASSLSALHDGYVKPFGLKHRRTFDFGDKAVTITDSLLGSSTKKAVAHFHLHPEIVIKIEGGTVLLEGIGRVSFDGCLEIEKRSYNFAVGFNKTVQSYVICITFEKSLVTNVIFD